MHRIPHFYRSLIGIAGLCCLLACATVTSAAEQPRNNKDQSITGELQGTIHYGDAYGFVVSDASGNVVNICMGNGDTKEFTGVTIGSVISLRYTTETFTPEADSLWQHKSVMHFYVSDSGHIVKKAPLMGWNELR